LFGGFVGILTRVTGFLKALTARVTNLPWAAEFHFAFTFTSCFLCHSAMNSFGSENGKDLQFFRQWDCFNRAIRK
jgi:hypothetical protein